MSSILSGDFELKVDNNYLKKHNFKQFYSKGKLATKFVNGNKIQDYHPHQKYWVWEDIEYNNEHFYNGYLYYFPKNFIGNAKSIICADENPQGYVYIYINNDEYNHYKEKIYVQSADDIEFAKILLKTHLDAANANTWSYWSPVYIDTKTLKIVKL